MSRGVVRGSKYRHVFGKALAKESWYEGIQGAGINAPDSNIVACNAKYFALAWKGGGGTRAVAPLRAPPRPRRRWQQPAAGPDGASAGLVCTPACGRAGAVARARSPIARAARF